MALFATTSHECSRLPRREKWRTDGEADQTRMEYLLKHELQTAHPWVERCRQTPRFGVLLLDPFHDWKSAIQTAQFIETLGYDSLWIQDHPGTGCADCWITLAALAQATRRIRLGSGVSCLPFRSPWHLARLAVDVDRLSNGRLILGIGIGDFQFEFQQLGVPWLDTRTRQQALEETVQILEGLWSGEPLSYHGTFFQVEQATITPRPIQHPRIPIMIGGGGEKVTLRQVAAYADMSNFAPHPAAGKASTHKDILRKYRVLAAHCTAQGRRYETILRSFLHFPVLLAHTTSEVEAKQTRDPFGYREFMLPAQLAGTPAEMIHSYQALIECGVQYFIAGVYVDDRETLCLLAEEVIPRLRPASGRVSAHA